MTTKFMFTVVLITPFLTVPSMAQQYHGGPKSSVPSTTQPIGGGGDIYAQGFDVYAPTGDIYAQGVRTNNEPALIAVARCLPFLVKNEKTLKAGIDGEFNRKDERVHKVAANLLGHRLRVPVAPKR